MKRILVLIITLSIGIFTVGCSSKLSVESLDIPIKDNMELKETYNKKIEKTKMEISTYEIKNENLDTFLEGYEKDLEKDGWTTRTNMKPNGIVSEKDDNSVTFIVYEDSEKLLLDIIPTPKADT
ncbi:hypothetical protein [Paratissierella segnis]|uniref:Lipoprotein n=1 Tax=Paratissierella segnis TaxID=2763679 RepID=A0A926ES72_9FIRM|nr:hypothetical protein [Paratissierella segnis]MBC8587555.1 hypothetical protein [Paratissierella segnis]